MWMAILLLLMGISILSSWKENDGGSSLLMDRVILFIGQLVCCLHKQCRRQVLQLSKKVALQVSMMAKLFDRNDFSLQYKMSQPNIVAIFLSHREITNRMITLLVRSATCWMPYKKPMVQTLQPTTSYRRLINFWLKIISSIQKGIAPMYHKRDN